jgi:hypothetical protein
MFYSYMWLSPDGSPYYVGKGVGDRAFERHERKNKLVLLPPNSRSQILIFDMPSAEAAFESEKLLIGLFGRLDNGTGCLMNATDGGTGGLSRHSKESIAKISEARHRFTKWRRKHEYRMRAAAHARMIWARRKTDERMEL